MMTIEERILQSKERTKRLENEKRIKDKREEEEQRKLKIRRQAFIGKLLEEHFPVFTKFRPQRTEAENRTEFALLDNILTLLEDDEEYVLQIMEKAKKLMLQQQND